MFRKISVKIAVILILVMAVIMTVFTVYLVQTQSAAKEAELLAKGRIVALTGAKMMERMLNDALTNGYLTIEDLFDENYVPIPGTDPPKYHTRFDRYLDGQIQTIEDEYLKDEQLVYAALMDRNGYVATHNSRYSQPLTGDREKDQINSRVFDPGVERCQS